MKCEKSRESELSSFVESYEYPLKPPSSSLASSKLFRISIASQSGCVKAKNLFSFPVTAFVEKTLGLRVEAKIPLHKPKVFAESPV
jgi:hypothetical protein